MGHQNPFKRGRKGGWVRNFRKRERMSKHRTRSPPLRKREEKSEGVAYHKKVAYPAGGKNS